MIVAWTDYDAKTHVLADYGAGIVGRDVVPLPLVTAEGLAACLSAYRGAPLLSFFGHGRTSPPHFVGQDRSELLTPAVLGKMSGWTVYGACCHSLGPTAAVLTRAGARVIGFSKTLHVTTHVLSPHLVEVFRPCMVAAAEALRAGEGHVDAARAAVAAFTTALHGPNGVMTRYTSTDDVMKLVWMNENIRRLGTRP